MNKNFYIFRHGQSSYNLEGRIQGHTNNSVLTPAGIQQAQATGRRLQNRGIEVIVSSPLIRAKQTAAEVSGIIGAPVVFDNRFIEVNVGVVEGLHYTKAEEQYGDLYKKWRSSAPEYLNVCFDRGETKLQVRERVFAALNDYALNSPYTNLAVSGHGIISSQALLALGQEAREIANGAVIHLRCDNGCWKFMGFVD